MNRRNASWLVSSLALLCLCVLEHERANASLMIVSGVYYDDQWFPLIPAQAAMARGIPGEFVNPMFTWRGKLPDGSGFKAVAGSIVPGAAGTAWREIEIVFVGGAAPRQFTSDQDIFSAAARGMIALRPTDEVYLGVLVGTEPSPHPRASLARSANPSERAALPSSVFPNPLNPSAKLVFATTTWGPARVTIYGVNGERIRTLMDSPGVGPGRHEVTIDGRGPRGSRLLSGVYFFRIETPEGEAVGRFAVVK
jgi:hypothetical protein